MKGLLLLLLLATSAAPATTYVLGAYTIETNRMTAADGSHHLEIRYSPYEVYTHAAWEETRYRHVGDPLGPRPYWDLPLPAPLNGWKDNPDLAKGEVFTLDLSDRSEAHWARFLLADSMIRDFLMEKEITPFLREHVADLNAVAGRLAMQQGRPISYADFESATLTRKNQLVLAEALLALGDRSVLFSREAIAPSPLPRLLKLSRSPAPITEPTLLVVHATREFDSETAKAGIDHAIADFKAKGQPVIFLMNDSGEGDTGWYTTDRNPTYAVFSAGGEHNIDLRNPEVTITGGFFGDADSSHGCQFKAMVDTISRYFLHGRGPLRLHLPLSAIYFYDDDRGGVDEFLAGRTAVETFFKQTIDPLLFNEDPGYLGMESPVTGNPSAAEYTFELYFEGKLVATRGTGARYVQFLFCR